MRPLLVRAKPGSHTRVKAHVWDTSPFSRRRIVLPVIGTRRGPGGTKWLHVRLPDRPNGSTGWVPAWITRQRALDWRIAVSLHRRRATVYRKGRVVRRFRVVVGARSTPTPAGHFFVVDRMHLKNSWAKGGWALATSGYSNILRHFEGGIGQVALHARGYLAAPLGTAASHGCIRFADGNIAWLAKRVPNGTPIDVTR